MRWAAGLLLFLVTGCSIATGRYHEHVSSEMAKIEPGKARVTVYRVREFTGSAANADVTLDGLFAGKLSQHGFLYYDIPAGRHELVLGLADQVFGEPERSSVTFEAGDGADLYLVVEAPNAGESGRTVTSPVATNWGVGSRIVEIKVGQVFNVRPVMPSIAKDQIKWYRQSN